MSFTNQAVPAGQIEGVLIEGQAVEVLDKGAPRAGTLRAVDADAGMALVAFADAWGMLSAVPLKAVRGVTC